MNERNIGIYLSNLTEYTKGNHVGEWVMLPCGADRMADVFKRLGLDNQESEFFITDYEVPFGSMHSTLGEHESIDNLNYLAACMQDMTVTDYNKFSEVINAGLDEAYNAADYINLVYNLDKYEVLPATDETELGHYIFKNRLGNVELPDIDGTNLEVYIDYEGIGRDASINYSGNFGPNGFVNLTAYKEELFVSVPEEYKILPEFDKETARNEVINEMEYDYER